MACLDGEESFLVGSGVVGVGSVVEVVCDPQELVKHPPVIVYVFLLSVLSLLHPCSLKF